MTSKAVILAGVALMGSLAAAQELKPLEIAAPDATVIVGFDLDRIKAAVAASQYEKVMTPEYRAQYDRFWQAMRDKLGYDLSQLKEVVICLRPGPKPHGADGSVLVILRGPFDPDRPPGLLALLPMERSVQDGVPMLATRPGKGDRVAFAFLDGVGALVGDPANLRAAITRWKSGAPADSPMLARAGEMSRKYHVWCVARGFKSALPKNAAVPEAGQPIEKALQSVDEITFGMNLAPDFQTSVELLTGSEKDASAVKAMLGMAVGMALTQAPQEQVKDALRNLQIVAEGRRVRLSLEIPEAKMIELVKEQMKLAANRRKRRAPHSTEVVVQGEELRPKMAPPQGAGDTQVITLPAPR